MPDPDFSQSWMKCIERLDVCNKALVAELESCWTEFRGILEQQISDLSETNPPAMESPTLEEYAAQRAALSKRLLQSPSSEWDAKRIHRRSLTSLETYDRNLADLMRSIPERLIAGGLQALQIVAAGTPTGWRGTLANFHRKERAFYLRDSFVCAAQALDAQRAQLEGAILLSFSQGIRQLRNIWEAASSEPDAVVRGAPLSDEELKSQRDRLLRQARERISAGDHVLSQLRAWPAHALLQVRKGIMNALVWRKRAQPIDTQAQRATQLTHWVRQLQSSDAILRLELSLEQCEQKSLQVLLETLDNLHSELSDLRKELEDAIASLQRRSKEGAAEGFPPPRGDIVPAASRMSELDSNLGTKWNTLPRSMQVPSRFTTLPKPGIRLRSLYPREYIRQAFERSGRKEVAGLLEEVEAEHRKIVQEIERAREVVLFGETTPVSAAGTDSMVLSEALQNALHLLEYCRGERQDWRDTIDRRMAKAMASVFSDCRVVLNRDRLGAWTYLARQGFRKGFVAALDAGAKGAFAGLRASGQFLERLIEAVLAYIGWRSPAPSRQVNVGTRPFLPGEFTADLSAKDLPTIYRHLFRFEAVQDPRFLIGREQELAAIAEARSLWEAGRPVAVIVIGQRGSGKTSLLNCALKRNLGDLELIRDEFSQRVTTEHELRGFLASSFAVREPESLEQFLKEKRRVVMLEEGERTFLRRVGGYEAVRALQRLIAATCSGTLWILAINQVAFQFLNAAVQLGSTFSHRIGAGSVEQDNLKQAMMVRHNLSGLRLQFRPPVTPLIWFDRVRYGIQGQTDPQQLFFDALTRESAGIYRSAFEMWLGQIDMVQAGIMHMKPWSAPDLTPIIDDLDLDDLFSLAAILQHGSLEPREHASVFQQDLSVSRSQLDELLAREVIEVDPLKPGLRIRPEATRVVKEALYRRNLI